MSKLKKWYSFSQNHAYTGPEPSFFDIKDKEWAKMLEQKCDVILEELQQVIASRNKNIIPYFNQTLADKVQNWTIFPLYIWGKKNEGNCMQCPFTTAAIESIAAMTSCSFSILKPNSSIRPHYGDSNVMYRCHLTLKCEHSLPEIGMRVRNESISWQDKKIFAFCDAYEHEVWNNTNEERWVLIVDVLREEFANEKKQICSEINATLFWQLKFQNTALLSHLPRWSRKMLLKVTAAFM